MSLIAFAYCVCKVLIALKLSFSFPYFEKLTGVVSVATGLMLMLMFTLSLVMNKDFLTLHSTPNYSHSFLKTTPSFVEIRRNA